MGELEEVGAISRRVERVPGMRGPGRAVYYMNPNVATHLPGGARDKAQRRPDRCGWSSRPTASRPDHP